VNVALIRERLFRWREKVRSSKDATRLVIGLTFFGFVFSVGTWHWWLEQKVGLYAWVFCVLATLTLFLIVPDRNVAFVALVFGGSYISVGRTWDWLHGEMPGYVPVLWVLGTTIVLGLAPKWKMVLGAALGVWALLGLKATILDREPGAIYITAIASALIVGLLLTARHSDT
jgi:hypothetical protein